jgi:hypothetical protein
MQPVIATMLRISLSLQPLYETVHVTDKTAPRSWPGLQRLGQPHTPAYATKQRHELRAMLFTIGSVVVIVMALYVLAVAIFF